MIRLDLPPHQLVELLTPNRLIGVGVNSPEQLTLLLQSSRKLWAH